MLHTDIELIIQSEMKKYIRYQCDTQKTKAKKFQKSSYEHEKKIKQTWFYLFIAILNFRNIKRFNQQSQNLTSAAKSVKLYRN